MTEINLMDLDLPAAEELMESLGEPKYRGKQLVTWTLQKGSHTIEDMTDLGKHLRRKLGEIAHLQRVELVTQQVSETGTIKFLFRLADGEAIESVFMPHEYGNSVCVSTQVGCKMGCTFCASTIGGMVRDLTAGEIYDQVLTIQQATGQRVGSIVLMGAGEPLDNYDNCIKFIRMISAPYGLNIGVRHITLSTCGWVPGIRKLAQEGLQITLSISLHAPNDQMRSQVMPVNKKYGIQELMQACQEYISITNRRISFEYSLIHGVNDSIETAQELGELLKGMLCHVNLIPVNAVTERGWEKPPHRQIEKFKGVLARMGIETTVRREMGADIDAACGQLRRKMLRDQE